jgi:hypothetical protein
MATLTNKIANELIESNPTGAHLLAAVVTPKGRNDPADTLLDRQSEIREPLGLFMDDVVRKVISLSPPTLGTIIMHMSPKSIWLTVIPAYLRSEIPHAQNLHLHASYLRPGITYLREGAFRALITEIAVIMEAKKSVTG